MNRDSQRFLGSIFPNLAIEEIKSQFGDLFSDIKFGPDDDLASREAEIKEIDETLQKLRALPDDVSRFEIRKTCRELSGHAKSYIELEATDLSQVLAISQITEYRDMLRIWNKNNPRIGGRDENANNLAEAVAYIFDQMGEDVKQGTQKKDGELCPSTKFGKVLKHAISYHEVSSNWLSPHRRIARKWKQGWRP